MTELKIERNGETGILKLKGELSICGVRELKEALVNALGTADHVIVDVKDVIDIDMACLQVLCSAHRTAVTMGKRFALTQALTSEFSNKALQCGFARHVGCAVDSQKNCIWVAR